MQKCTVQETTRDVHKISYDYVPLYNGPIAKRLKIAVVKKSCFAL